MEFKNRRDLVGKRFLCIYASHCSDHHSTSSSINSRSSTQSPSLSRPQPRSTDCSDKCLNTIQKLKSTKIQDWPWKSGIIRASTHQDSQNPDLTVLVEFDDKSWDKREWIKVYEPDRFQLFLIEHMLVWCCRKNCTIGNNINWPALNYEPCIDRVGLKGRHLKPVEYLDDKELDFKYYEELTKYEESSLDEERSTVENSLLRCQVNQWVDYQKQQNFLIQTPSILTGYRVQVYRAAGNSTTQWFTAVIGSYLESNKKLVLTDDTVLEEHYEDPTLIQMNLIGDGVINSILKGEDQGIVPRRRACTQNITSTTYNISSRRSNNSSTNTLTSSSLNSVNSLNSQQLNQNSNNNLNNSKTASTTVTASPIETVNKNFISQQLQSSDKLSSTSVPCKLTNNNSSSSPKPPQILINSSSKSLNHNFLNSTNMNNSTAINLSNPASVPNSKDADCLSNNLDSVVAKKPKREKLDKLDSADSKDNRPTDLSQKQPITDGFQTNNWLMSNNSSKKIDKTKSNQIESQTHFRPAPMLKQVTKTKTPSYITQPINKSIHSHLPSTNSSSTNSVHTIKSKQAQQQVNNSISNLQVNNNLVNLNSSTLNHNSATTLNQQQPVNYSTALPFMSPLSNVMSGLTPLPAHSSNNSMNSNSLINSTINSVVNMTHSNLPTTTANHKSDKTKATKSSKGRPPKSNQKANCLNASNNSYPLNVSSNQTTSTQFNLHQLPAQMINQQQWNSINQFTNAEFQKQFATQQHQQQQQQQQQLTNNLKPQQTTTSSLSAKTNNRTNFIATAEQMNNKMLKMQQPSTQSQQQQQQQQQTNYSALLNSNVNMNSHQLIGSIYDHQQTATLNKLDYASLLNGNHPHHQLNGLLNSTQLQPNQSTVSMFNNHLNSSLPIKNLSQIDMMKLTNNPEQSKLLMAQIEKYQQMGSQSYVPNLNVPTSNSSYLNSSIPLNSVNMSLNHSTNPQLISYPMTTNLNNMNQQMNNQINHQLINSKPTVASTQLSNTMIKNESAQQTKKLTKFNIASICENELSKESQQNNKKETSKPNVDVDQQQLNRAIESNSPANSESNSNNSLSYKYMKLKKTWLNNFENQNNGGDQPANQSCNDNAVVKKEVKTEASSLELLAEASSLKQRTDCNNIGVKQETDLKCKEEFKFTEHKPISVQTTKKPQLEDAEEDSKLKVDQDDNTSVSSNNASSCESDAEQSTTNGKTNSGKKSRSKLPKNGSRKRVNVGRMRTNRPSKDEEDANSLKANDQISDSTSATNSKQTKRTKTTTANKLIKRLNKSVRSAVQDNNSQFSNCSSTNSINSERESSTRNSSKFSVKNSFKSNATHQLDQQIPSSNLFCNLPISQLKKTGQSFLQEKSCVEVAPKLEKCRECFLFQNQNQNKKKEVQPSNIFCRFYAFRKLFYDKNELKSAGFSDSKDANKDETNFWLPGLNKFINLNSEEARFILQHAGDQLCDLINEELRAMTMHCGTDESIRWKRVVQGVREMCDVCETTLFNVHWTCLECGFCVCIECYVGRLNCDGSPNNTALVGSSSSSNNDGSASPSSNSTVVDRIEHNDRDAYNWLLCKNDKNKNNPPPHEQSKLVLTQIVTGDSLNVMARKLHVIRNKLGIKCNSNSCKDGSSALNFVISDDQDECTTSTVPNNTVEQQQQTLNSTDVLTNSNNRPHNKENKDLNSKRNFKSNAINNFLPLSAEEEDKRKSMEFFGRDRKLNNVNKLPPRICKIEETSKKYSKTPHQWLCDGRLLWLEDSELNDENLALFKEQWIRGQPLIVSGIADKLNPDLWNANQLSSKMTKSSSSSSKGNTNNTMFNCKTNEPVKITLSKFWEGFEIIGRRVKESNNGQPLCLKLKDWPPGDDFCELLPEQFNEFFTNIPLPSYTKKEGSCNLAARLPTSFVKPDLGPKMYTAYGCDVSTPDIGTTNLHLDISDALNVMVYVTVAKRAGKDGGKDPADEQFEYLNSLDDIDAKTKKRIVNRKSEIGALWHVYEAKDADCIRTYLKSIVAARKDKVPITTSGDPIHDQSFYLTTEMRKQLKKEYGVVGYSIVQLLGDAVFLPAGAPHQVRNIHSAIKLACDFVSPENVNHCFDLTGQFRMLSNLHSNHEDKLQIKNIIYHAVKDALTVSEQTTENNGGVNQEMATNRTVEQFEQDGLMNSHQSDNSMVNEENNKRDALKSANLNDGSTTNKLINETSPTAKRSKGLNVNERSKRAKLNENTVVQPQITTNDLNNNTNSSPKRRRDETVEPTKVLKKNRKEPKTLKMK